MKYMGSKARIAKHILPIMLKAAKERGTTTWVEPFVGGANMIDKVPSHFTRIGVDINHYLIEMWTALQSGWVPPSLVTEDDYNHIKDNKDQYPACLVGYVGVCCSYSGKWFGGFAGKVTTKLGTIRNYQAEAFKNVEAQVENLKGVNFISVDYRYLSKLSSPSLIYCDPPYAGTTKYKDNFDHNLFWEWCREKSREGHLVFVSEYNAPPDFECVWSLDVKSSLSANGKSGGNKVSTEKLFIFKP